MLYLVGTPIGNLDDISYRQAKTLTSCDVILTEDTRSVHVLFKRIEEIFHLTPHPKLRLISYYKEKEFEKLPEVVELLENNHEVALISQAGLPLISDPGYLLTKQVIRQELPFTVIPGITAAETALLYSGFNPSEHLFLGFFPKKQSDALKQLHNIKEIKQFYPKLTVIFYESPHRIQESLKIIAENYPEAKLSISRELTKKFEETMRGSAEDLLKHEYKGEICLIIG